MSFVSSFVALKTPTIILSTLIGTYTRFMATWKSRSKRHQDGTLQRVKNEVYKKVKCTAEAK